MVNKSLTGRLNQPEGPGTNSKLLCGNRESQLKKNFRPLSPLSLFLSALLLWQVLPAITGCKNSTQPVDGWTSACAPGTASVEEPAPLVEPPAPPPPAEPEPPPPPPPLEPVGRQVFHLLNNRALGHLLRDGGLAIFAGDRGFVRYARGNMGKDWFLLETEDQAEVAFLNGRRASLSLPFPPSTHELEEDFEVLIRLKARPNQTLDLSLNGHNLGRSTLEEGWQTVRFPVNPGTLTGGENTLSLTFARTHKWGKYGKSGGPIQWFWVRRQDHGPGELAEQTGQAGAPHPEQGSKGNPDQEAAPALPQAHEQEAREALEKASPEPAPLMVAKHKEEAAPGAELGTQNPTGAEEAGTAGAKDTGTGANTGTNASTGLAGTPLTGINLPGGGGVAWYVAVPPDAHLDLVLGARNSESLPPCTVTVSLQGEGAPEALPGVVPPYGIDGRALEPGAITSEFPLTSPADEPERFRVELDDLAGQVARLEVQAGPGCNQAVLVEGGLFLNQTTGHHSPAPPAQETPPAPGQAPQGNQEPDYQDDLAGNDTVFQDPASPVHGAQATCVPPKNVIFYLIDTLRADRIKAINPNTRIQCPGYERMAKEGATFTQVYSQGNESFVSHGAIFTGQYPKGSSITRTGIPIPKSCPFMAEAIKEQGSMATVGYTSNGYIARRNGYLRGWDTYVNTLGSNVAYLSPALYKYATTWLTKHGDGPFFMYLGPVDPHVTYRSHKDILPLYDPDPYTGPFVRNVTGHDLGKIKSGAIKVSPRDKVRIEAIYDDEVTFAGNWLNRLLDWLEEAGTLDDTMIIVTSDHGDEFWEHGSVGHGHSIHEELVHVPLMIRYPACFPAGSVYQDGADTIDVFPTILDALGMEIPGSLQGESLMVHREESPRNLRAGYPRPSVATHYTQRYAMRLGRWKMMALPRGKYEVYDVASDPTGQENLYGDRPVTARYLMDPMALFLAYEGEWNKGKWGVSSNLEPNFNLD